MVNINKKAFTMFELIFVVIFLSILAVFSINEFISKKKDEAITNLVNSIVTITKNYVLDVNNGYLNGSGGYCSDDNTFNKIDAYRAIQCIGLLNRPFSAKTYNGDTAEKNGANSVCNYISITGNALPSLKALETPNGEVCRIHYTFDSLDTNVLYVGINCSYLKNTREKALLEKLLINAFKQNFPSVYDGVDQKWTITESSSCSQKDSGSDNDGELKFTLKID